MKRYVFLILLVFSFLAFDGKAHAEKPIEKPVVLQQTHPLSVIEKPEIEKVAEEKEKIAEQVEEKSEKLEDTAEEIKSIETKAQTLASEIEAKRQEIEVLKQKVAEKNAGGRGGGDEGTVAVVEAPAAPVAPAPVYAGPNTYEAGQCTWHVKNLKPNLPNGLGNADQWYWNAVALGLATGTEARPGAAAPRKVGMHVVYVMEVYADGTMLVSEMNHNYIPYEQRTAIKNQSDFYYIY